MAHMRLPRWHVHKRGHFKARATAGVISGNIANLGLRQTPPNRHDR